MIEAWAPTRAVARSGREVGTDKTQKGRNTRAHVTLRRPREGRLNREMPHAVEPSKIGREGLLDLN